MARLRVIELFAGIGAQAQALNRIGADWESVDIVEVDPYCVTAYNAIFHTHYEPKDITKVEHLKPCDMLTYSFPCTDISTAGKQMGLSKGSGTRSSLLHEVARLLDDYEERNELPKYLIMENVKNLVGKKFKADFDEWVAYLKAKGYETYWKVLNACDFGIPQHRESNRSQYSIGERHQRMLRIPETYPTREEIERHARKQRGRKVLHNKRSRGIKAQQCL